MINDLPSDILVHIFSFLSDKKDVRSIALTKKQFEQLSYPQKLRLRFNYVLQHGQDAKQIYDQLIEKANIEKERMVQYLVVVDAKYQKTESLISQLLESPHFTISGQDFDDELDFYEENSRESNIDAEAFSQPDLEFGDISFTLSGSLEQLKEDPANIEKFYKLTRASSFYVQERENTFLEIVDSLLKENFFDAEKLQSIKEHAVDGLEYCNNSYVNRTVKYGMTEANMYSMYFYQALTAIVAANAVTLARVILTKNPQLINLTLPQLNMWSLLGFAIHYGRHEMVDLLLEFGADSNQAFELQIKDDFKSFNLLQMAVTLKLQAGDINQKNRMEKIIISLLENGAKPLIPIQLEEIFSEAEKEGIDINENDKKQVIEWMNQYTNRTLDNEQSNLSRNKPR